MRCSPHVCHCRRPGTGDEGRPSAPTLRTPSNASDKSYVGRKPTHTREQLAKVHDLLGPGGVVGIAHIAKETGLSRQTVYRIKHGPGGAEAALTV